MDVIYIIILAVAAIVAVFLCHKCMVSISADLLSKGLASPDTAVRTRYLRKAAIMGNKEAILAYACNNPDQFDKPRMLPFDYYMGFHHFPCVYADHYFAKGLTKYLSTEQKAFMKRVYAFDGLEEDCDDLIEEAIKKLEIKTDGVVIVFMPCSNDVRFKKKFQHLSWKLQKKGYESNHMTYPYLSVRNQKDDSSSSEDLMSHVRQIVGVDNRKVIVVDDVLNTGKTLQAFAKELKKYNAKIAGAVFISKVFSPPKNLFFAWLKIALNDQKSAQMLTI